MLDESAAYDAALAYARATMPMWDVRGFILAANDTLQVEGCYVFGYGSTPDADGRPRRFGGNWPILVDATTGECRSVAGLDEYRRLRRAMPTSSGTSTAARYSNHADEQ